MEEISKKKTWAIFFVLTCGGFLGGLIGGLSNVTKYRVVMPFTEKEVYLGTLGDCIVGIGASLAAYFFLSVLFKLDQDVGENNSASWFKILSISIICGYIGLSVLNSLSKNVEKMLVDLQTDVKKLPSQVQKSSYISVFISQARLHLDKGGKYEKNKKIDLAREEYEVVLFCTGEVLRREPNNIEAKNSKAAGLIRLAANGGKDAEPKIRQAFDILNKLINNYPRHPRAYYNRACAYILFKFKEEGVTTKVLEDLRQAIELDNSGYYAKLCKSDPDFDKVRKKSNDLNYSKLWAIVSKNEKGASK